VSEADEDEPLLTAAEIARLLNMVDEGGLHVRHPGSPHTGSGGARAALSGGSISAARDSASTGGDPPRGGSMLSVVLSVGGGIARHSMSLDVGRWRAVWLESAVGISTSVLNADGRMSATEAGSNRLISVRSEHRGPSSVQHRAPQTRDIAMLGSVGGQFLPASSGIPRRARSGTDGWFSPERSGRRRSPFPMSTPIEIAQFHRVKLHTGMRGRASGRCDLLGPPVAGERG
jgi:hypothetical protein